MVRDATLACRIPFIYSSRRLCPAPEELFNVSTMEPLLELLRVAQKGQDARPPASRVHLSQPVHLGEAHRKTEGSRVPAHRLPL